LLFATDAHKKHRWKKYSKIVRIYRDILNQLPEEVAKKIAYLNAEKIYNIKN
jgi:predicted TIM-barrel fold metal-dependent hydrolase